MNVNKQFEQNTLLAPALIIAAGLVAAAWISARSGRYLPMPQEGRGVSVIDTRSGDVYTQTSIVRKGKRVWRRGGPRLGTVDNE